MNALARLTDASLHSELKRLVGSSNTLTAQLLAHLGEVEARGIHREWACSSLYTYCVYELRMSEDEAQRRCRAARLARQFPVLLDMLAEASLHLTGMLLIGPHLTAENCADLLARVRFRTEREIERLVAEIAPCHDVSSRIVPLGRAGAVDSFVLALDEEATTGTVVRRRFSWAAYVRSLAGAVRQMQAGLGAGQAPPRASGPTASAPPVAELRYKVQFTADQAYVDLLEEARNLLQHQLPTRDLQEVQRRALALLVHKLRQRKYAASGRPRRKAAEPVPGAPQPQPKSTQARPLAPQSAKSVRHAAPKSATHTRHAAPKSANHSRYISAAVRRSVWQRDEARCTYVDARGQRCREQSGLEFHHQHPHARGGPPRLDNLALRCRSHNELAAEQDFGREVIRQKRRRKATLAAPTRAGAAPIPAGAER